MKIVRVLLVLIAIVLALCIAWYSMSNIKCSDYAGKSSSEVPESCYNYYGITK